MQVNAGRGWNFFEFLFYRHSLEMPF
jgi:hypothetical protein